MARLRTVINSLNAIVTRKGLDTISFTNQSGFVEALSQNTGICVILTWAIPILNKLNITIEDLYMSWPHFSGDTTYPVKSTDKGHSAGSYYQIHRLHKRDMYDRETEYGRMRISLARHMAKELEKLL